MSCFTDYYSFLDICITSDTATILKSCDTKSRKIDIEEEQTHDTGKISNCRGILADAYENLVDPARRKAYKRRWLQFKYASNQQKVKYFVHEARYSSANYQPHAFLSRPNKRGQGEMCDQFFRRMAHKQAFALLR